MTEWTPPSKEELAKRVGRAVRTERNRRGWSQQDLADRLETTPPYLSQLERGTANLTLGTIARLAQVFRLPPDWFLSPVEFPLRDLLREPPPFEGSQRLVELATVGRRVVAKGE